MTLRMPNSCNRGIEIRRTILPSTIPPSSQPTKHNRPIFNTSLQSNPIHHQQQQQQPVALVQSIQPTSTITVSTMQLHQLLTMPLLAATAAASTAANGLEITYALSHTCKRASKNGDTINAHYRGTLAADGKEFDASYNRGQPLTFVLGAGRVIKGWDLGLLDMCPGDKRTLRIPPELGYGNRGMGPIPAGSTLVFETELVGIVGVDEEERVVKKEAEKKGTETEPEAPVQEENPQEEAEKEQKARQEL